METVYLFGAGINQGLQDLKGLRPPLSKNFFQMYLKHDLFGDDYNRESAKDVYQYIYQYWKLTEDQLLVESFDLEECFTLLHLQISEAEKDGDESKSRELRSGPTNLNNPISGIPA